MTRLLILGGSGMLGHKLWQRLRGRFDTYVTVRRRFGDYERYALFDSGRTITDVDAERFDSIERAFGMAKPDVMVNGIGVVKQLAAAKDPIASITINSLFPHRLANLCRPAGSRLIHISTDCVFSGRRGMYTEADLPDPDDLYGRSKLLGEVTTPPFLTLRTSMIGRELNSTNGLVEWFLASRDKRVRGFRRAVFSGLPTMVLADVIGDVIESHSKLEGLYHLSAAPISKYDLLQLIRTAYNLPVEIDAADATQIDRSLDSSRFRAQTGWVPPFWPAMIRDLAADPTPYGQRH